MKFKKLAKCSLATALIFGSVGAISGCKKDNDNNTTEKTEQEKTYDLYVQYMNAKGDTPLTYEQWLASIKGEDGISPKVRINENTNYWEISTDNGTTWTSTGVKATGAEGEKGNPGDDAIAPQVRINQSTNYWEISTDNGTTWTSTGVKATGAEGEKGDPGDDAIAPQVRINQDTNYWEISTDNGTTWNSTGVKATGAEGEKGDPGDDAIAPQVRINQDTNYWEISTDNGVTWNSTGVKATGENGQDLAAKEVTVTYNFNLGNIDLVNEIQNNNLFKTDGFEVGDLSYENDELTFKMIQKTSKGDYFDLYDYFNEMGIGDYFDGWYVGDIKVNELNVVANNIELTAKWKKDMAETIDINDYDAETLTYVYDEDKTVSVYIERDISELNLKELKLHNGAFYKIDYFYTHPYASYEDCNVTSIVLPDTIQDELLDKLLSYNYALGASISQLIEYETNNEYIDSVNGYTIYTIKDYVFVDAGFLNKFHYVYKVDYVNNTAKLVNITKRSGGIYFNPTVNLAVIPLNFNVSKDGMVHSINVTDMSAKWFGVNNHLTYDYRWIQEGNKFMGFIVEVLPNQKINLGSGFIHHNENVVGVPYPNLDNDDKGYDRNGQELSEYDIYHNPAINYNYALFLKGTEENYEYSGYDSLNLKIFFYSETEPTEEGNYWHYDTDGKTPVVWVQE